MKNVLPRGRGTRIRNILGYQEELTIQGQFEHSDNLPPAHQNALESLFGSLPVTPRQQVNRIKYYAKTDNNAMNLYEGSDEYTATSDSDINIQNGVFPTVFIEEIRPPRMGGHARMEYTIKLAVGFEL